MAEMGARVNILRVAFKRGTITGFSLLEFSLLKINVAELRVVMRLVEMMNLRLQLADPLAILSPRKLEARRAAGAGLPVNVEEIDHRGEKAENEDEDGPDIVPTAQRVDQHPEPEPRAKDEHKPSA